MIRSPRTKIVRFSFMGELPPYRGRHARGRAGCSRAAAVSRADPMFLFRRAVSWRCFAVLRSGAAVDVAVELSGVRTGIAAPTGVRVERSALWNVRARVVVVGARLPRVDSGEHVAAVGPRAVGGATHGRDPQVVAGERHGPVRVLLPVQVGADVGQP